jgi:hypothetical protein
MSPERDELPNGLLERLLDSLKVPKDRRVTSGPLLRSLIRIAHMDHALDVANEELAKKRQTVRNEFKKLARRAADFRAAFDELSDESMAQVRLWPSWSGYKNFCLLADDIIAASADLSCPKAPAGRPSSNNTARDLFVSLLYGGECDGHWRITVDPASGTGTLVDFLKLAEPYLPKGFSNDSRSGLKSFQRIGTQLRSAASDEAGWFSEMVAKIERTL